MSKLNQKGFMMAEVIIVSTIILGTLVGLYSIFNRMYIVYTERSYYYNIDTVYALRTIYKKLIENDQMNSLINDGLGEQNYIEIIKNNDTDKNECNDYLEDDNDNNLCSVFIGTYGIDNVLFVRYKDNVLSKLNSNTSYNSAMKDYFNYLDASMDFSSDYSYMFIIELVDGNYHYYGNYRIR